MKTISTFLFSISVAFFLSSCQSGGSDSGTGDFSGYEMVDIGVAGIKKAIKKDNKGNIMETGYVKNGKKAGEWNKYRGHNIVGVKHYIDGKLFGPALKINDRNQVTKMEHYKNDKLDGLAAEYKFSRPIKELLYSNGKLDGQARYYFVNSGKLQKLIDYKQGIIDGEFKQYNEEGQLILEYKYENGKKVSGGVVDLSNPEKK